MDTKSLMAFKAVYEAGSITKAAAQLYITQQGMSRTIAKLEAEVGHPLFERTTHGVEPTAYARVLYRKAEKLTKLLDSVVEEADKDAGRTTLDVASVSGVLLYTGLDFIGDFEREHPRIDLQLEETNDRRVAELLESGVADIGMMAGPVDRGRWEALPFSRHRHVLVVNEKNPLAVKEHIEIRDLEGQIVTLLSRDYTPYSNNLRRFAEAGVQPARLIEYAEGNAGLQLAASNQAVCIFTDYAARALPLVNVVVRPLGDKSCSWDVFLVWKKGIVLSEEARSFRTFALGWIDSHRKELFSWEYSVY